MSKAKHEKPNLEWFQKRAPNLLLGSNDTFLRTYPDLITAIGNLDPVANAPDFVLAAHAVWGWMPAILDLEPKNDEYPRAQLRLLINLETLPDSESEAHTSIIGALDALRNCIGTVPKNKKKGLTKRGHSIIGASKLLHFIAPDKWPITDSQVRKVWPKGSKSDAENYLSYAKELRMLTLEDAQQSKDKPSQSVHGIIQQKLTEIGLRVPITPIRAFEMVLFYQGKKKSK